VFVAELGDVTRFADANRVCSWTGLTPKHRESDTTVHRGAITKQGSRLVRWAAIEAVQLAVLIGTYLHDNPTQPSPFTSADHPSLNVTTDFCPSILGLKAPFGDAAPRCP
jgi:hypothetical protein